MTLWVAAAAAVGVLAGVLLADRAGGTRGLLARLRGLVDRLPDEDDELEEEEDESEDEADFADPEFESAEVDDTEFAEAPRIDARVLATFEQDPVLSRRSIEIDEPEPATIVLTGRVESERDARHAVAIALGVPGVSRVENLLRVRAPRRSTAV